VAHAVPTAGLAARSPTEGEPGQAVANSRPPPSTQPGLARGDPDPIIAPSPSDARDLALLHAHRAGDPNALTELLTSYQDRLFGVCVRMVGDAEAARDLAQEAMVKIIQGLAHFQARSKLSTWMIRVTMNVCLTSLRRQKLRKASSLEATPYRESGERSGMPFPPQAKEPSAADRVQHAEDCARLYRALERIDPQQRAMLILRDMHGFDYRAIGDLLEVPEGTVKSRLFRARAALREQMERLEAEAE